ncbi:sigma-54 dependent transcriptional regulator [Pseudomaricurvus sp. HS19]|uniref:sigma-54 dependent transcriptional regulator n=1 Tax=Pseudomaricurvus sp. HS19 TaxID=2692626 RepID=UPI00136AD9E1|nr:sigma-54 dependent transcriptional regulator [Pseudomaricurvus sp. HS19]MYM63402.1 AAA domain-containing protein [Pseudomaricurvus sp. HS19]
MFSKNLGVWHVGFCKPEETRALAQQLPHWRLVPVHLPHSLPINLSHRPMAAAIVCLSSAMTEAQLHDLTDTLQNNPQLPWVALLNSDGLQQPRLRQLVTDFTLGFQLHPVDAGALDHMLRHAHAMHQLRQPSRYHHTRFQASHNGSSLLGGNSSAIQHIHHLIERAAAVDAPVLITGESGTGKELVARELHRLSPRRNNPFVAVNCGAIPQGLTQSELFGHEKGAFTNATERQIGKVESAHQGSLFLDEIGELPLEQQVNFLRFLQDGVIQRVGGRQSIDVDLRIIAATNADLESAISEQLFREDLYYRLNVLHIHMPPLRERDDDCVMLAEQFLQEQLPGIRPLRFSPQATKAIRLYPWPGNVRELKNRIFKAAVMAEGQVITTADLDLEQAPQLPRPGTLNQAREQAEADSILASLRYTNNNVSEASRLLQISRPTLYKLMSRHNISPDHEEYPGRQPITPGMEHSRRAG